jgi:hypothetical protein
MLEDEYDSITQKLSINHYPIVPPGFIMEWVKFNNVE